MGIGPSHGSVAEARAYLAGRSEKRKYSPQLGRAWCQEANRRITMFFVQEGFTYRNFLIGRSRDIRSHRVVLVAHNHC